MTTLAPEARAGIERAEGDRLILNMGPQHPATHGVLRLVLEVRGEKVVDADVDVGYLHRGMEKIAEAKTYNQFIPYTDKMDYLAPLSNNVAIALAAEKLFNIRIPRRCQYIRVLVCELARISAHLLGLGTHALDMGAMTIFFYTFREREKIYDLSDEICGARMNTVFTRVGGISRDLKASTAAKIAEFAREFPKTLAEIEDLLNANEIFMARTKGIGGISAPRALALGLTGPNLRGSGLAHDLRKFKPYLVYDELDFKVATSDRGDAYGRYLVRLEEMKQSLRIIDQVLQGLPEGPVSADEPTVVLPPRSRMKAGMEELIRHFMAIAEGPKAPPGEAYFGLENPKGELGFYYLSDGGSHPYRLKIRSPSFCNLQAVKEMVKGVLIADVITVLGSLDFVLGEVDR